MLSFVKENPCNSSLLLISFPFLALQYAWTTAKEDTGKLLTLLNLTSDWCWNTELFGLPMNWGICEDIRLCCAVTLNATDGVKYPRKGSYFHDFPCSRWQRSTAPSSILPLSTREAEGTECLSRPLCVLSVGDNHGQVQIPRGFC